MKNNEKSFADRIDSLLRIQNRTRKSLCDSVGISINAISTWKARETLPSVDTAMKIAKQLNTTLDYLVYGETVQNVPETAADIPQAPEPRENADYPGMSGAAMVARIDTVLQSKNLKRVDMCRELGIATSIMSTWKARNSFPAADTALRIADFLGVPFRWLVAGECETASAEKGETDLKNDSYKNRYENLKSEIIKTVSEN